MAEKIKGIVTNGSTFVDIEPANKSNGYYTYHKIKKKMPLFFIFLLVIQIVSAYPNLMYNKNRVSEEDLIQFKTIMSQIPEEHFNNIEVITIRNRPHYLYNYDGYFKILSYRSYITIYNFKYLEDYEVYNILLHELGHFNEFKQLKLTHSIYEISCIGFSEAYAEEWRKQHGGDETRSYSSN